MACDHIPYITKAIEMQYYDCPWYLMHAFGRFTAPIFFYLLALGYRRTRNANRYTLRLLVFAVISYVPYIWYFEGDAPNIQNFHHLNVIFTMLFGLLLLRSLHEVRYVLIKAVLVILCLLCGFWCDYGLYGLAMILICDIAQRSRHGTVFGMGAAMMVYIFLRITHNFPNDAGPFEYIIMFSENSRLLHMVIVLLCQALPLILIFMHNAWDKERAPEKRPGPVAKWGFYIFYPAHITVLLLIRLFALG
ncbi:MAG: conjugal transfer protein TraX [Clostridiales bacterium]|nr:conjugal transfer protein TraX [Clostridiales bacterium]